MILAAIALVSSIAAPTPPATASDFTDVAGNSHETAIRALADSGVLDGTECGTGRFCPDEPIKRWIMAVWLVRVLGEDITADGGSRFADVDPSAWWSTFAEQLAVRNVTAGCKTGPLRYCPQDAVTRGQMATFLVRAFGLVPAASPAGFSDTSGDTHESNIDALAASGITAGCRTNPLRYCPQDTVTRGQMAAFLHRAMLQQQAATEISADVPDVTLTDLADGQAVNLRSLVTGDTAVLLWFWAEW